MIGGPPPARSGRPAASARPPPRSPRDSGTPAPRCAAGSRRRRWRTARTAPGRTTRSRRSSRSAAGSSRRSRPRRCSAGCAASARRVDEDVEGIRPQRQRGRQPVDESRARASRRRRAPGRRAVAARGPTACRGSGRRRVRRMRSSMSRSRTELKTLALAAASSRHHGRQHQPQRRHAPGGQEHRRHGGHQQQLDDPGLGQADVRRPRRREPGPAANAGAASSSTSTWARVRRAPPDRTGRCSSQAPLTHVSVGNPGRG